MARHRIRAAVGRLAKRVETWSRNDLWLPHGTASGFGLRRRTPCVFDDADNLSKFLEAIQAQGAIGVSGGGIGTQFSITEPDVGSKIANLGRRDRLTVTVSSTQPTAQWSLVFNRNGPTLAMMPDSEANRILANRVLDQVDRFTRPVRRLGPADPVVQPQSQVDAIARTHDRKMSRRSIIWGFVGGALASPIVQGLISWLVEKQKQH